MTNYFGGPIGLQGEQGNQGEKGFQFSILSVQSSSIPSLANGTYEQNKWALVYYPDKNVTYAYSKDQDGNIYEKFVGAEADPLFGDGKEILRLVNKIEKLNLKDTFVLSFGEEENYESSIKSYEENSLKELDESYLSSIAKKEQNNALFLGYSDSNSIFLSRSKYLTSSDYEPKSDGGYKINIFSKKGVG